MTAQFDEASIRQSINVDRLITLIRPIYKLYIIISPIYHPSLNHRSMATGLFNLVAYPDDEVDDENDEFDASRAIAELWTATACHSGLFIR